MLVVEMGAVCTDAGDGGRDAELLVTILAAPETLCSATGLTAATESLEMISLIFPCDCTSDHLPLALSNRQSQPSICGSEGIAVADV